MYLKFAFLGVASHKLSRECGLLYVPFYCFDSRRLYDNLRCSRLNLEHPYDSVAQSKRLRNIRDNLVQNCLMARYRLYLHSVQRDGDNFANITDNMFTVYPWCLLVS